VIQLSGEGVKTAVVSIPCRYMHTPHELCSEDDVESAIRIIGEFMRAEYILNSLIDDRI
jgi:endoglucanase